MGLSSNTVHLQEDDHEGVVRAYTSMLRQRGYRPRASGGIPHYLETCDESIFRRVLISRPRGGWITIVDQAFDEQNLRSINRVCQHLTQALRCHGMCFVVHDSEAFYYFYWHVGELVDRYCSWPAWYSEDKPTRGVRKYWKGNAKKLRPLCLDGVTDKQLRDILVDYSQQTADGLQPPTWAEEILEELAECLGISDPAHTYRSYHDATPGLYLAVPGPTGQARGRLRINRPEQADPYWSYFVHLDFMRTG